MNTATRPEAIAVFGLAAARPAGQAAAEDNNIPRRQGG